jgi:hypothetical protein
VGCLFNLEAISFVVKKICNFMKSHLSILSLSHWASGVLLRKSLPIPISSRVFPGPSCSNFRVSVLIFRSLIHFQLILVQGDRKGSSFSFLQMGNHFSQQHLLKRLSFLHCMYLATVKNEVGYSRVDSYLDLLFCSTGLHICFLCQHHVFIAIAL